MWQCIKQLQMYPLLQCQKNECSGKPVEVAKAIKSENNVIIPILPSCLKKLLCDCCWLGKIGGGKLAPASESYKNTFQQAAALSCQPPSSEGSARKKKSRLKALLQKERHRELQGWGYVFLAVLILKKAEAKHTDHYPNNFSDCGGNSIKGAQSTSCGYLLHLCEREDTGRQWYVKTSWSWHCVALSEWGAVLFSNLHIKSTK